MPVWLVAHTSQGAALRPPRHRLPALCDLRRRLWARSTAASHTPRIPHTPKIRTGTPGPKLGPLAPPSTTTIAICNYSPDRVAHSPLIVPL